MGVRHTRLSRATLLAGALVATISAHTSPALAILGSTSTSSSTTSTTLLPGVASVLNAPPCAQPVSVGALPKASDCLFILNVGVGIGFCVPACICDVNGDFDENASDALLCLKIAVGIDLPRACPCPTTTTTSTSTTTMPGSTGACCVTRRGTCVITTEANCRGTYLGNSDSVGVCSAAEQATCDGSEPTTTTTLDTTTTTMPPVPSGACCVRGGGCIISPADRCAGVYLGDRMSGDLVCDAGDVAACAAVTTTTTTSTTTTTTTLPTTTTTLPALETGACCTAIGCGVGERLLCELFGGHYLGPSELDSCTPSELAECMIIFPTTTTTTTTLPPVPTGACCVRRSGCIISPADRCNGVYLGDRANGDLVCDAGDMAACEALATTTTTSTTTTTTSTTTTTLPGAPTGKCCTGNGGCDIITEQACLDGGGEYGGDDPNAFCSAADVVLCVLR